MVEFSEDMNTVYKTDREVETHRAIYKILYQKGSIAYTSGGSEVYPFMTGDIVSEVKKAVGDTVKEVVVSGDSVALVDLGLSLNIGVN